MYSNYYRFIESLGLQMIFTMLGFALLIAAVLYIFQSVGLYTLAKRRGLRYPGLAWVPVASGWTLGCLADQYDSAACGKKSKQRALLLTFSIAMAVLVAIIVYCVIVFLGQMIPVLFDEIPEEVMVPYATRTLTILILLNMLSSGLSIVYLVFFYIALYKIYKSCDPDTALPFLLLSIFISVTLPFFLFAGRNKDLGMEVPETPSRPGGEL